MTDRTQNTLNNIARGVEIGSAGLGLLERIIALFRPKPPEVRAEKLRNRAKNKRTTASTAKSARRRKNLLEAANDLETRADKLAPSQSPAAEVETG